MHKFIVIIIVNIYVQWTKTARHGLDTFRYLCLILMIPQSRWSHFCPYFIDKETEAWRDGKPQPLGALLALPSLGENLILFCPLSTFSVFLSLHASGFLVVTVCFCFSVYGCFACMRIYAPLCVGCHQRIEEGICREAPSGCWELNPDLLQEHLVLNHGAISPTQKSLFNWDYHHRFLNLRWQHIVIAVNSGDWLVA